MTRRLTIDDATAFEVPGIFAGHSGSVLVQANMDEDVVLESRWRAGFFDWETGWSALGLAFAPTAQAALDAAIAAGATIDEGAA